MRPWLAAVLSLLVPGVVHAYLGRVGRGVLVFVGTLATGLLVTIAEAAVLILPSRAIAVGSITLAFGVAFGFVFFVAHDAYHVARRSTTRRMGAALAFLVASFVLYEVLVQPVSRCFVRPYKMPSRAMAPTLLVGDHVMVDMLSFGARYRLWSFDRTLKRFPPIEAPRSGDIVVFTNPRDPAQEFMKRVVAVAGESVEMRDRQLYVDGEAVQEPFAVYRPGGTALSNRFGPLTVPPGQVFLMGDNRDESYDSRSWGPIPTERITGLVRAVYWSWDPVARSVRWDRVGQPVSRQRRATTAPADQLQAATSARVAAAGSSAARMARITAMPCAPAPRMAGAVSRSMPPIASTGTRAERTAAARRSVPCGAPNAALDGVANTGPKKTKSAPVAAADAASWTDAPMVAAGSTSRATSTGNERSPRCTPSAPTATATSRRSFT
jgi:signal peptidase I